MKVSFDFGKTKNCDIDIICKVLQSVANMFSQEGMKFGGCTIYTRFYDENGRIVEMAAPITNEKSGEAQTKRLGFLVRNARYKRNEDNENREFVRQIGPEAFLYRIYEEETWSDL